MTSIAVVGCGYVGAVTATCLARLGHSVHCIDTDAERIDLLRQGIPPIHEPGLEDLLASGLRDGLLMFDDRYPDSIDADIVFVAVNTPGAPDGAADLRGVREAVKAVAIRVKPGTVIVNKSTVPIGTGELVAQIACKAGNSGVSVVSNPEFLREGTAIDDFMQPDRIVLGSTDVIARERVAALYEPLGAPILRTDIRTAEMIKYASNAFLATKISFINEVAAICEAVGADVEEVSDGMGMDPRIGPQFLSAGLGWGGNCFPKDVRALVHMAAIQGAHPQLLRSVMDINTDQRIRCVQKVMCRLGNLEGHRVTVLGATFKSGTDDTRNSPALELAELLYYHGASVVVYDPVASAAAIQTAAPNVSIALSLCEAVHESDALVVATDWPEFKELDFTAIRGLVNTPVVVDARNCLDAQRVEAAGFSYDCVGRPSLSSGTPPAVEPFVHEPMRLSALAPLEVVAWQPL